MPDGDDWDTADDGSRAVGNSWMSGGGRKRPLRRLQRWQRQQRQPMTRCSL